MAKQSRKTVLENALRHIGLKGGYVWDCERYTSGIETCWKQGRRPDAEFGSERCCASCIAHRALYPFKIKHSAKVAK